MAQNDEFVIRVVHLDARDAAAVARLHRSAITTGFLSALGEGFTVRMYRAILSCPAAFGLGIKDEAGELLGFIACAEDIRKTYRYSILLHGLSMSLSLLRYAFRFGIIRRLWETFRYPSAVGEDLPAAEVLSIAVWPMFRSQGFGQMLLNAAGNELRRRGVQRVKVAVGAANTGANRFYERCGFRLAVTRQHHGEPMNIYTAELAEAASQADSMPAPAGPSQPPRPSCPRRVDPMSVISRRASNQP